MLPDWSGPVAHYVIHEGLPNTLRVAAIALVASTLIGVVLGTVLTIDFRPTRWLIRGYVEIFRGLPILVTVFIVYFGLPSVGIVLPSFAAAVVALGLHYAAYMAEIYRAGIAAVDQGQGEAASAIGIERESSRATQAFSS